MANELNNGGKNEGGLVNRLITSPKQAKTRISKRAIKNSIIAHAYTFIDSDVEAVVFSQVSFCENLTFIATAKNKVIIFEDCTFHKGIYLYGNAQTHVIFRGCRLREDVNADKCHTQLDMIGCTHLAPNQNYYSFIDMLALQEASACN